MIVLLNTDRTTAGTAQSFSDDDLVVQICLARDILKFDLYHKRSIKIEEASAGWLGYDRALSCYGMVLVGETIRRGIRIPDILVSFRSIADVLRRVKAPVEMPPWWGNRDIMNSHRSYLMKTSPALYRGIFKGPVPKGQPAIIPVVYDDDTFDFCIEKGDVKLLPKFPHEVRKLIGVFE